MFDSRSDHPRPGFHLGRYCDTHYVKGIPVVHPGRPVLSKVAAIAEGVVDFTEGSSMDINTLTSDEALTVLKDKLATPVMHTSMPASPPPPKREVQFHASAGEPRLVVNAMKRSKKHTVRLFCETVRVAELAKATNRSTKDMVQALRDSGEFVKDGRSTIPALIARQFA